MTNLKEALIKAGLAKNKTTHSPAEVQKKSHTPAKKHEHHFVYQNFCDACQATLPDVEYYQHRKASLDAKWLCVSCADKESISDEFRQTEQSEYGRRGIFRRQYGRTLRLGRK